MKNKILNSGFGIGNIVFIAAVILALPLRIYQYVAGTLEPGTGFYTEADWSVYVLYAVLLAAAVASVVIGIIKKKTLGFSYEAVKNPLVGTASALSAAGLIIDVFTHLNVLGQSHPSLYADAAPAGLPSYNILLIHNAINHTIIKLNRTQNPCQIIEILQDLRNENEQLWYHIVGIN